MLLPFLSLAVLAQGPKLDASYSGLWVSESGNILSIVTPTRLSIHSQQWFYDIAPGRPYGSGFLGDYRQSDVLDIGIGWAPGEWIGAKPKLTPERNVMKAFTGSSMLTFQKPNGRGVYDSLRIELRDLNDTVALSELFRFSNTEAVISMSGAFSGSGFNMSIEDKKGRINGSFSYLGKTYVLDGTRFWTRALCYALEPRTEERMAHIYLAWTPTPDGAKALSKARSAVSQTQVVAYIVPLVPGKFPLTRVLLKANSRT